MSILFLLFSILCCCITTTIGVDPSAQPKVQTKTRRHESLDHLNLDTLAYYLGLQSISPFEDLDGDENKDLDYDVAVLFYAQWDQYSHALAPYWNKIAVDIGAGTKKSKLVMGLFDCEFDTEHSELCTKAGVKGYPTMQFIATSNKKNSNFQDTDTLTRILKGKDKSAGPAGAATIPHTIKFQGDWQYTDSVRDWITTMRALTKWNSYSNNNKKLIPKLRQLLLFPFFFLNKNKNVISDDDLPVGLPSSASANLQTLASEFKTVKEKGDLMELAATHASLLLENVLFPSETKDPFTTLTTTQSWSANNKQGDATMQVLRACLVELSLDYCSRLSTRVTNSYVDEILADPDAKVNMTEVQDGLKKRFEEREPYCAMFDDCFEEDFVSEICRPMQCPYKAKEGCAYVASCFDTSIQTEYAVALNFISEGDTFPPPETITTTTSEVDNTEKQQKSGGWLGI